jgi:hypothetical protein
MAFIFVLFIKYYNSKYKDQSGTLKITGRLKLLRRAYKSIEVFCVVQ